MNYEYAVMHKNFPNEPHRGPWPLQSCIDWIDEAMTDGFKSDVFYIARRPSGGWERYEA